MTEVSNGYRYMKMAFGATAPGFQQAQPPVIAITQPLQERAGVRFFLVFNLCGSLCILRGSLPKGRQTGLCNFLFCSTQECKR